MKLHSIVLFSQFQCYHVDLKLLCFLLANVMPFAAGATLASAEPIMLLINEMNEK